MGKKGSRQTDLPIVKIPLLLIFLFFLLVLLNRNFSALIWLIINVAFAFLFSVYFWIQFFPETLLPDYKPTMADNFKFLIDPKKDPLPRTITRGKFERDYFIIQKKPKIQSIFLDRFSAVILCDTHGNKRVVLPGLSFLKKDESILHTFDISAQMISSKLGHPALKQNLDFNKNSLCTDFDIAFQLIDIPAGVPDTKNLQNQSKTLLDISNYFSRMDVTGNLTPSIGVVLLKSVNEILQTQNNRAGSPVTAPAENLIDLEWITFFQNFPFLKDNANPSNSGLQWENSSAIYLLKNWNLFYLDVFIYDGYKVSPRK